MSLNHKTCSSDTSGKIVLGYGVTAAPGLATGELVFTAHDAQLWAQHGKSVILARTTMSMDDLDGMKASVGVLTMYGGPSSHGSFHTRNLEIPTIVGANRSGMSINEVNEILICHNQLQARKGDLVTLDGATGQIYFGNVDTMEASESEQFKKLLSWSNKYKKINICCSASNISTAKCGLDNGADGVGLYSLDDFFKREDVADSMRLLVLAKTPADVTKHGMTLENLISVEFTKLFALVQSKQLCIKLLGPNICNLLCLTESSISKFGVRCNLSPEELSFAHKQLRCMCGVRQCCGPAMASCCCDDLKVSDDWLEVMKSKGGDISEVVMPLSGCQCVGCNVYLSFPTIIGTIISGLLGLINLFL